MRCVGVSRSPTQLRRKGSLLPAAAGASPEDLVLSGVTQIQKDTDYRIHAWDPKHANSQCDEESGGYQGLGAGKRGGSGPKGKLLVTRRVRSGHLSMERWPQ